MTQAPSFATLPADPLMIVFSYLPFGEVSALGQVCIDLNSILKDKAETSLWKPVFKEMLPNTVEPISSKDAPLPIQVAVKAFFLENRKMIDSIVNEIKDDKQLAKCLHTKASNLEEFKAKPAFERSRLMWRALHQDATPVIVKFLEDSFSENVRLAGDPWENPFIDPVNDPNIVQFKDDRFTPIVVSLIQNHKVPYNKIDFICALVPLMEATGFGMPLLLNIINSHADLSELNHRTCIGPMQMRLSVVQSIYVFLAHRPDAPLTNNNLKQCNIFYENGPN